ncbi:MAG: M3 family metallopeptidase [Spongiibacteraceae bacterium]
MNRDTLPVFSTLNPKNMPQQCQQIVDKARGVVKQLLAVEEEASWQNLMAPLEDVDDELGQFMAPLSHLHGVLNSDAWRDAYSQCLPILTAYSSEMGQNRPLYQRVEALAGSAQYHDLSVAQQKVIANVLRDFRLSGVGLEGDQAKRYSEIQQALSERCTRFSNQVLDATDGWEKIVEDRAHLAGVPDMVLENLHEAAVTKGKKGYRLGLDLPSYLPIMQYAEDRELREELYRAYVSRASNIGPDAGKWDNGPLMEDILQLRQEKAALLGFAHFADYSLATKMAESSQQVIDFLCDLAETSRDVAEQDYRALCDYAAERGVAELAAWDIPYFSEQLKEQTYQVSQERLRPYFPIQKVIDGLFQVSSQLFNIEISSKSDADLWHEDAQCYQISRDGKELAYFYFDLYARQDKRGGAWMADCRGRRVCGDGSIQTPVAFLVCNFSAPTSERPSLLTHNEVTTLFHEFGHGLQHMLTQIDSLNVSGISGVAWDAVELPSQFMENWCWQKEIIPLISGHYQSGEPLPDNLLETLLAARNYQSGMQMLRQIEFALFDFRLHSQTDIHAESQIEALLKAVRDEVAVVYPPAFNRFQNSFSHIFAGGYAAGYYSYKWAEVLSADAFSLFEEEGLIGGSAGDKFRHYILERGGAEDAAVLFEKFRGRAPSNDALLRHSGIARIGG